MTDYGVVILSCFVAGTPSSVWKATKIANCTLLPLPTVSKILKLLAKGGVLESHRGVQGGYSMSRYADEITVADIVRSIDGPVALTECVDVEDDESGCSVESLCPMRGGWDALNQRVNSVLESVSLREIAAPVDFITGYDK